MPGGNTARINEPVFENDYAGEEAIGSASTEEATKPAIVKYGAAEKRSFKIPRHTQYGQVQRLRGQQVDPFPARCATVTQTYT